jgi:signal peptidase II
VRELQTAGGTSLTGEDVVPGTSPAQPGTDPATPGTSPAQPGTDPATPGTSPAQPGTDPATPGPHRRRVGVLLAVAVTVLAADAISKSIVVATLSNRPPIRLLGGFLTLTESRNPGAAFSIGPSLTVLFTAIAVGVIVFILRTSGRIRSLPWAISLGLLLGGATGNLTDRLLRSPGPGRGYVVDWIRLPHWPIFNIADSAIVCGGVLAVLLSARGLRIDGTKQADQPGTAQPGDGEQA